MGDRILSDWLDGYCEYTHLTESAKHFHLWAGVSTISSCLRKKISLGLGRIRIYPNVYVIFVSEPGIARKSQAIDYSLKFLSNIGDLTVSADSTTREALLQDIEGGALDETMPDGSVFRHTSISIISKEFESFMGQKTDNNKMLVLLTDLYDCSELPWKYRTKNSGTNILPSVFVNLLGATTPDSLASQLPATAIGGGLTSRVLFVWSDKKEKKITFPIEDERALELKAALMHDLHMISRMCGQYEFTPDAREYWHKWYMNYDETSTSRSCTDPSFRSWYSRKPTHILKVAMSCAASQSGDLFLTIPHLQRSISMIEAVEEQMGKAFSAVGKSSITSEVNTIMEIVRAHGTINERTLMKMVWRDMDSQKLDNVINTVLRTGRVKREYPKGGGVEYIYIG